MNVEDKQFTCWCGVTGKYGEMFNDEFLDVSCGGYGILDCHCGGDICVCHNHGEALCEGCDDCVDNLSDPEDWSDEDWSDNDENQKGDRDENLLIYSG